MSQIGNLGRQIMKMQTRQYKLKEIWWKKCKKSGEEAERVKNGTEKNGKLWS